MKGLYKNIGNYDTTNLINIVSNQTENDWNKHRFRQETYPVHSSTGDREVERVDLSLRDSAAVQFKEGENNLF